MSIQPFEIHVPQATLDDLHVRLGRSRPVPTDDAPDWDAGMSPTYLRELVEHWQRKYDWRVHEARLNRLSHFRASLAGTNVHFLHERGKGPAPLPILLTHGYPDSFVRFLELIPLLADPAAHGADPRDAFHVVVPSMPGYAFSDPPGKAGGLFHVGDLWHRLMRDELGYARFGAHGGDWGSTVTEHLARSHASSLIGIHLTDVPFWHTLQKPDDTTPAEDRLIAANIDFQMKEGAYAMIQGSRPETLADSLNDSPAGLAAWIIEKFQRWSDCDGEVERRFTKDELLTNVMIYWVTGSIGSSFMPYYDVMHAGAPRWILEKAKEWLGSSSHVPAGFALFPRDIGHPPREWAKRFFNVQRWTELPRGGHFTAMEEPEALAEDLRAFFRPLRA
jgi:microsomal epoxide hydrolase